MLDIKENIELAPYTTFKIGGPARYFVEVQNEEELIEALEYAKNNNLEFFILGGGSNVLFSDKGFNGLVIKNIQTTNYKLQTTKIECWVGDALASVVKFSVENSLTGLEWAAGIPGTIGGAIQGNAGAFGGCMADSVESVKVIEISNSPNYLIFPPQRDPAKAVANQIPNPKSQIPNKLQIANYKLQNCDFSYRSSIFKQNTNLIILSCVLKLEKGNGEEIKNKTKEYIEKRGENQPKEATCGSFFKNVDSTENNLKKIKDIPRFLELKLHEKNTIPSGFVVEEAGLKGKKIGGAMVSEKHANFIINTGNATAEDVINLSSFIKQQVRDRFGIELQEEVQLVGF